MHLYRKNINPRFSNLDGGEKKSVEIPSDKIFLVERVYILYPNILTGRGNNKTTTSHCYHILVVFEKFQQVVYYRLKKIWTHYFPLVNSRHQPI